MLKSNFIKPKLNIEFFGKTRFWGGLFLGISSAFLLYSFFSFFKLALHHATYMEWVGYSINPPEETSFYQYVFAFVALLMGQHFFFEFALSKPRKIFERNIKKKTVLHNSRFGSWFTLFVGFKFIVSIGLLAFVPLTSLFGFYTLGWWASILLIIWWHFFTWTEVSRIFKDGRKWSLISYLGIGLLSFIFIQKFPNLYSNIYRVRTEHLAHFKLKINLPVSDGKTSSKLIHQTLVQTFFVGDPEENDTKKVLTPWSYQIDSESIPLEIENFNHKVPESKRSLIISSIAIDKEIKMRHVYKLLKTLGENHRYRISFATLSPEQKHSNLYFETFDKGLLTIISLQCKNLKPAVEMIKKNPKTTTKDLEKLYSKTGYPYCEFYFGFSEEDLKTDYYFVKLSAENEFSFNDIKIDQEELFEKIKDVVWEKKENAIFVFDVDDNATYQYYFFLRQEHRRAMNEVRNQSALIHFGTRYKFLEKARQKEIRSKYPILLWDFFSPEEKYIFDFFRNKSSDN